MANSGQPRITFGIIVLNGEPFTRYCLRSIYPFAHQIIVVEGANRSSMSIATEDAHSIDGTLEILRRFKAEEDPEDKVTIVTRDGPWEEKDEQSRAYARLATGDYLWQVDIDEFYRPRDMVSIMEMLSKDPGITAVSFKQITFWGGLDYTVDGWYLQNGADIYHRLFKWGEGYTYAAHRPPTVRDPQGRDLRTLKWVNGHEMAGRDIFLYHYSLLFPKQVLDKSTYYSYVNWTSDKKDSVRWAKVNYEKLGNPYRVHNVYEYPSWLKRFHGRHPPEICRLMRDIKSGLINVEVRDNADVEKLLSSTSYYLGVHIVSACRPISKILTSRLVKSIRHSLKV